MRTLLADGESQSAGFMTTYVNAVQPVSKVYDGFMVHSNSAVAAPITGVLADTLLMPNPSRIRTDLTVPTFVVLTETDVPGAAVARQPDTASVVHWELAARPTATSGPTTSVSPPWRSRRARPRPRPTAPPVRRPSTTAPATGR